MNNSNTPDSDSYELSILGGEKKMFEDTFRKRSTAQTKNTDFPFSTHRSSFSMKGKIIPTPF
jgi:hypothetical protein